MIGFVEKEHFTKDNQFYGRTYAPVYMVKDEKEFFVVNRIAEDHEFGWSEYNKKKSNREVEGYKAFLIQNGGKYFKFHGFYDDPIEMLATIKERGYAFTDPENMFVDTRDGWHYGEGFVDFHGNLKEVSAAFHYRIYDEDMLEAVKRGVKEVVG